MSHTPFGTRKLFSKKYHKQGVIDIHPAKCLKHIHFSLFPIYISNILRFYAFWQKKDLRISAFLDKINLRISAHFGKINLRISAFFDIIICIYHRNSLPLRRKTEHRNRLWYLKENYMPKCWIGNSNGEDNTPY